jgi:putative two-component system response regulator
MTNLLTVNGLMEAVESHGYQVRQAQDGQEALEAAKRSPLLALILVDLSMPMMDGWEFMRRQRLEPSIAHIPIVVITAQLLAVPPGADTLYHQAGQR